MVNLLFYYLCQQLLFSDMIHIESFVRPPFLKVGDSVGVVAIASQVQETPEQAGIILDRIRSWGLNVKLGKHLFDRSGGYFPASDAERSADLQAMIDDPAIKAIIFYRGGYGSVRTLDYLNLNKLLTAPKWFVGFSDITVIHYALQHIGLESIHGNMPSLFITDLSKKDVSAESMRDALFGRVSEYHTAPFIYNQEGSATGRLVGGNMALIANVSATDIDNFYTTPSILFMEDIDENIYAIDRRMQMFKRAGKLNNIKGLIFGYFTNTSGEDKWGSMLPDLLHEYVQQLDIPVLFNFPSGHELPNYSLYFGREVNLTVNANGGTLSFI